MNELNKIDPFVEFKEGDSFGFRKERFVPVDCWIATGSDIIFTPIKGFISVPVSLLYGDPEPGKPIDLFYLNTKRCYNNMRDHTAHYLNYFEKFYDPDHELWAIYANIKLLMDTQTEFYTKDRFLYDITRMILNPYSSIFAKVNQMNEENYCLQLVYRNNKNPALQYTDYHAKLMMRASVLMNAVVPLITHFMYVSKVSDSQEFILNIFTYILTNLCDDVDIINKLYETTTTNINRNANSNAVLWEIQDIRGKSTTTHIINCVENIIVAMMPKYVYNSNIIHFNYNSIIQNTNFQILNISYEFTYVKLSSIKRDEDNNSEFDKYESFLTKENEFKYLITKANYDKIMHDLEMIWGPIEPDEVRWYHKELSRGESYETDENGNVSIVQDEHSCIRETQKNMIFLLFYKYFGSTACLREINYVDYIKLIIIAKRMLLKSGMIIFPYIISGKFEVSKVKSINVKERSRMEANRLYDQVKEKYRHNNQVMDLALDMISKILASKFTIIDYDNEAINGLPVPMINDLIIEEVLMYILMI